MGAVKLEKMGESVVDVSFEGESAPLETVLEGVDTEGYEVTVNGEEPVEDQRVNDGDVVTLVPEIAGG
ncbi:MAG TPA: hypothetical protein VF837_00610 [Patescibacteria group bacterium]